MNRERELLRHNIRGQIQRIWIACSLLRMKDRGGDAQSIMEIELATAEILRETDTLSTTKYPRSERPMEKSTFDKIMDLLGASGAAISVLAMSAPTLGLPAWLVATGTVIAWATGRAAGKGIPIISSFAPAKKDARGQVADVEEPK